MKDSGWIFDMINSMTVYFYKTGELKGYIKFPLKSNAIVNIENENKYCFLCSILAYLHPCKNIHPNRVSFYKQYFNELNINGFDFSYGFKCSDVHRFNEINNLSINIFELIFYQDQNKWRHKLIPIEISKNESHRDIDLLIYENHYALKKFNVILGDHHKSFICSRCMNSHTSENMLMLHKRKYGHDNITTIKISNESHIYWKKNIFIRIHYILECMQISKLIMKKIILV